MTIVALARGSGDRVTARQLVPLLVMGVNVTLAMGLGLATTAEPLVGIGLGLAALAVLAIVLRPNLATLLFLALLYSNAGAIGVQRYGLPFPIAAAFPLLLLLPLGHHLLVRQRPLVLTPATRLVLVLLVLELVSALFSSDVETAVASVAVFAVEGVLLVLLVTNAIRDVATLRAAVWVLVLVGGMSGVLSAVQQVTGDYDQQFLGFAQVSRAVIDAGDPTLTGVVEQPRLAGMVGEKNKYAQVLIVLLPLAYFRVRDERSLWLRLLALGCAAAIATGIALTFSRGAALGFGAVLGAMVLLRYIRGREIAVIVLAAGLLLAAFPAYAARIVSLGEVTQVDDRTGDADPSIESRLTENIAAALAVADHPVLGVGPGLFPSYYRRYADEVAIRVQHEEREAHNLYLGVASELGIPGLIVFLAIFWVVMRALARERRRWLVRRPDLAGHAAAILLALVAYLATGVFLHLAYERYLWILIALGAVTAWIAEHADEPEPPPGARQRLVEAGAGGTQGGEALATSRTAPSGAG